MDNFFLKARLGLADYRVQSYDAIVRWHALVFAAYAFLQFQRVQPLCDDPKATLPPLGDVLADHQRWYGRQMILAYCRSGAAGHEQRRTLGRVDALITNRCQRQRQPANSPAVKSDQHTSALGLTQNAVDLAFARVQLTNKREER